MGNNMLLHYPPFIWAGFWNLVAEICSHSAEEEHPPDEALIQACFLHGGIAMLKLERVSSKLLPEILETYYCIKYYCMLEQQDFLKWN